MTERYKIIQTIFLTVNINKNNIVWIADKTSARAFQLIWIAILSWVVTCAPFVKDNAFHFNIKFLFTDPLIQEIIQSNALVKSSIHHRILGWNSTLQCKHGTRVESKMYNHIRILLSSIIQTTVVIFLMTLSRWKLKWSCFFDVLSSRHMADVFKCERRTAE